MEKTSRNQLRWKDEFGAAYKIPAVLTDDIELMDDSWHNDACPSFRVICSGYCGGDKVEFDDIRLWAEHINPKKRETGNPFRYSVYNHTSGDTLIETNSVDAAIETLKTQTKIFGIPVFKVVNRYCRSIRNLRANTRKAIHSFEDLHTFTDPNVFGLDHDCDPYEFKFFGIRLTKMEDVCRLLNAVHDVIDVWLKAGRHLMPRS